MKNKFSMKIFKVQFEGLYPVGSGCIIAAEDYEQALDIATKTITHTNDIQVEEVDISSSKVILYISGDY